MADKQRQLAATKQFTEDVNTKTLNYKLVVSDEVGLYSAKSEVTNCRVTYYLVG